MFNSVEYVRDVCRQRKIPVAQLEKDCGFANGYLNPKKLSKIPYDRVLKIASYLNLSVDYILTGEEKAPTPESEREASSQDIPDENYIILSRNAKKLSPEQRQQLLNVAKIMFKEEFKD